MYLSLPRAPFKINCQAFTCLVSETAAFSVTGFAFTNHVDGSWSNARSPDAWISELRRTGNISSTERASNGRRVKGFYISGCYSMLLLEMLTEYPRT